MSTLDQVLVGRLQKHPTLTLHAGRQVLYYDGPLHWVPGAMNDLPCEGCMGIVRLDQQISLESDQRVTSLRWEELGA